MGDLRAKLFVRILNPLDDLIEIEPGEILTTAEDMTDRQNNFNLFSYSEINDQVEETSPSTWILAEEMTTDGPSAYILICKTILIGSQGPVIRARGAESHSRQSCKVYLIIRIPLKMYTLICLF
jgi:hypothetical protein